jgi:hypothetical protein
MTLPPMAILAPERVAEQVAGAAARKMLGWPKTPKTCELAHAFL